MARKKTYNKIEMTFQIPKYIIFIIIIVIYVIIHYLTNKYYQVPEQSDEPYHLNQTLIYVNNYYQNYLSTVTTFPLSFIITSLYLKFKNHGYGFLLNEITNKINRNDYLIFLSDGRVISILMSLITLFIISLMDNNNNNLMLITFFTFPLKFLYSFLIYTENFSILLMTLYYYFENCKKTNNKYLLFLIGLLSILSRQLNIIWINMFPLMYFIQIFFYKKININILFDSIKEIIIKYFHVFIIDISFIVFFIVNNFSFVLGDKGSHKAKIHLTQINHFLFYLLWHFPFLNFKLYDMYKKSNIKNKKKWLKNSFILFLFLQFFHLFMITRRNIFIHTKHYNRYYYLGIYYKFINRNCLLIYFSLLYGAYITDYIKIFKKPKFISWLICNILSFSIEGLVEPRYFINGIYILIFLINNEDNKEREELSYYLFNNKINISFHIIQDIYMIYNLIAEKDNAYVY